MGIRLSDLNEKITGGNLVEFQKSSVEENISGKGKKQWVKFTTHQCGRKKLVEFQKSSVEKNISGKEVKTSG